MMAGMGGRTKLRPSEAVACDLRRRIVSGEWAYGQVLPTVKKLSEEYQVSRKAVSRGVHLLQEEGLVAVVERWGVFCEYCVNNST